MTFEKGQSGNPAGRPRGARNKRTLAAESMFDREASQIIDKVIDLAKAGDVVAIRLCLDRIYPRPRERPVALDLPPMTTPAEAVAAMGAITDAVGDGELGPQEAADLAKVVAGFSQTIATADLEARLSQAEKMLELLKPK
jgi:hypothetical protein